jgi:dihydroorotate dehydrogenase
MYVILRNFLFRFDAEKVHYFSMNMLKNLCALATTKYLIKKLFYSPSVKVNVFGLTFRNSVGLAAGFDKNAAYLNALDCLGFGFVEIGTVTPLPQAGNEKPRLFRLPADKAIINRMGFNNDGMISIAENLKKWRSVNPKSTMLIGGNIGKNKITPNEVAWQDYTKCFETLFDVVDYFVVNVSSPNTPGLRELQEKDALKKIFQELQNLNQKHNNPKPILLKIAPDLNPEQLNDICSLTNEVKIDGLVATNTTISRENLQNSSSENIKSIGLGGLSGAPVKDKSTAIIKYLYQNTNGIIPIVGSGGIFTAADANEKLNAGASLVQVWTGFIYQGPGIVKAILRNKS